MNFSSGNSLASPSIMMISSKVPANTRSSVENSRWLWVGLTTNSPPTSPTRTAPMGPPKGMSDTHNAADAPLMQSRSESFSPSALSRVAMIWVS